MHVPVQRNDYDEHYDNDYNYHHYYYHDYNYYDHYHNYHDYQHHDDDSLKRSHDGNTTRS